MLRSLPPHRLRFGGWTVRVEEGPDLRDATPKAFKDFSVVSLEILSGEWSLSGSMSPSR